MAQLLCTGIWPSKFLILLDGGIWTYMSPHLDRLSRFYTAYSCDEHTDNSRYANFKTCVGMGRIWSACDILQGAG